MFLENDLKKNSAKNEDQLCVTNDILFWLYQLVYESLRGTIVNESIVTLLSASKRNLGVTVKPRFVLRRRKVNIIFFTYFEQKC